MADAGENERPNPDEIDVAGEPRVRPLSETNLVLGRAVTGLRNGLHDSERIDGVCESVTRRWSERRVGVGDENESEVEHSDLALLFGCKKNQ